MEVESPQRRRNGGARTCSGQPDPKGFAQIFICFKFKVSSFKFWFDKMVLDEKSPRKSEAFGY